MGPAHAKRWIWTALVLTVAVGAICGAPAIGLLLLPAFLLAVPLLLGRYPGEELLVRRAPRTRAARSLRTLTPRAPRLLGARLAPLATAGASRAPPCAA